MPFEVSFAPIIPWIYIFAFTIIAAIIQTLGIWRKQGINWAYLFAFLTILIGAINPQITKLIVTIAPKKLIIISDYSPSIFATNRQNGVKKAREKLLNNLKTRTDIQIIDAQIDIKANATNFAQAIDKATNGLNNSEIGAIIFISDGLANDGIEIKRPYPIHQLVIGQKNEIDQFIQLIIPPFPLKVGEQTRAKLIIHSNDPNQKTAKLRIKIGNESENFIDAPINKPFEIPFQIRQSAQTPISIEAMPLDNEISTANNAIITQIEGIQDRLRVLLVTGEPYEGARAWRNLLKSDPSLDLVHFTILRSPLKEDVAREDELSLIPFPTEELFIDKLDEFDLVVFDRFENLVGLRDEYFENVAQYVEKGGALLIAFGQREAENEGVMATSLRRIIPINALPEVINGDFYPKLTEDGKNHPITANFNQNWGKWDRYFKTTTNAETLIHANNNPLLIVDDVAKGRIALIMSDKSWYWQRGYDGGGPFRELIGRTTHWLMHDSKMTGESIEFSTSGADLIAKFSAIDKSREIELFGDGFRAKLFANQNDPIQFANSKFGIYETSGMPNKQFYVHQIPNETSNTSLSASPDRVLKVIRQGEGGNAFYLGIDGNQKIPEIPKNNGDILRSGKELFLSRGDNQLIKSISTQSAISPLILGIFATLMLIFGWLSEGRKRVL